jgi:spermidine synthase
VTGTFLRRILLLCFFVSGATGLVYEVVWARYLSAFIGGTAIAHTIVLATFMGGLALGNAWLGRRVDRVENKLLMYAILEFGIGGLCLVFPELFSLLGRAYVAMAVGSEPGSFSLTLLKALLAIVAILPICVLMGGTLPVLAKAIVGQLSKVGTRIGQVYSINTAGALAGIVLAGFYLVEHYGLSMSVRIAAVINVVIGFVFLAMARGRSDVTPATEPDDEKPAFSYTEREIQVTMILAGATGMLTMILEVVWIRLVAVVMGSSTYSFSTMLLGFIGGLCLGSALVSWIMRKDRDAIPIMTGAFAGVAVALMLVIPLYEQLPYYFNVLNSMFQDRSSGFGLYLTAQVGLILALTLVPTTLIGMALPLAPRVATRRIGSLGTSVGSVFSINTIGTLVGAVVGGLLLIPNIGLDWTFRLVAAGYALMALALWIVIGRPRTSRAKAIASAGLVMLISLLMVMPQWDKRILTSGVFRLRAKRVAQSYDEFYERYSRRKIIYYEDGLDDTVAVIETPGDKQWSLVVNGKTDSSDMVDMMTQRMLGHLGMILRPHSKEVMVIGLGGGVTVASVRTHPGTRVDVVEISSAVARASRYFDHVNKKVLDDPNVTLHLADAKDFLRLQPNKKWDLIVSQPPNPWIVGVGNLFTLEYWQDIQNHLTDDGLLIQWIHTYEMDDEILEIVFQTFGKAFPHASLWEIDTQDLVLLGAKQPINLDFAAMEKRTRLPSVQAELRDPNRKFRVAGVPGVLAMEIISDGLFRTRFPGDGPLNTDDRPRLEFMAPKALFRATNARLPRRLDGRRRAFGADRLLDRYLATRGPLSADERLDLALMYIDMRSPLSDSQRKSLVWDAFIRGGELLKRFRDDRIAPPPAIVDFPAEPEKLATMCEKHLAQALLFVNDHSGPFHHPQGTGPARLIQACASDTQAIVRAVRQYRVPPQALAEALIRMGDAKSALVVLGPCQGHPLCHAYRVHAWDLLGQGRNAAAELKSGLEQHPNSLDLRYLKRVCTLVQKPAHCSPN